MTKENVDPSFLKEGLVYLFTHPHAQNMKNLSLVYIGYDTEKDRHKFHSLQTNKVWLVEKSHLGDFTNVNDAKSESSQPVK